MPLSEKEQRILDELEKQLQSEDPTLMSSFAEPAAAPVNKKRLGLGVLGIALGLCVLVFAVATKAIWLGVLAFLLMLASAVYGLSTSSVAASATDEPDPAKRHHPAFGNVRSRGRAPQSRGTSSIMKRFEERWEKRNDDPRSSR